MPGGGGGGGYLGEGRRGDREVQLLGKKTWSGKLHLLQLLDALHVHLLHVGGGLHDLVVLQRLQDTLKVCGGGTCTWGRL